MWRFLNTKIDFERSNLRPFNRYHGNLLDLYVLEVVDFQYGRRVFSITDFSYDFRARRNRFIKGFDIYRYRSAGFYFCSETNEHLNIPLDNTSLRDYYDYEKVALYASLRFPEITREINLPYMVGNPDLHPQAFLNSASIVDTKRVNWQDYQSYISNYFYNFFLYTAEKRLKKEEVIAISETMSNLRAKNGKNSSNNI